MSDKFVRQVMYGTLFKDITLKWPMFVVCLRPPVAGYTAKPIVA